MNELQQKLFAATIREAFLNVGTAGYKAARLGLTEDRMLEVVAASMEDLVQSVVRMVTT